MSNLIESILSEDFVSASELFESHMQQIAEHKLLETKKALQAEVAGGMSRKELKAREDAGFVRASAPVEKGGLGLTPYDINQEKTKKRLKQKLKKLEEKDLTPADQIPTQTLNRNKSWEDRYKAASERAKALELRGAKGQSKMVNRVYRAYKVGDVIGRTGKSIVGNIARGLADLAEE